MKDAQIQFEPSLATKTLHLGTRKAPCILEKTIHPGFVHTASPGRDVALTITAFLLEGLSLGALHAMLPFHVGIVAGLAAFDTAGALLTHTGVADAHLRAAKIAVAKTDEEKEAITAQRPAYFKYLRVLGAFFVVGPLVFKIGSLLVLPFALQILGGLAPALIVAFVAIAIVHLFVTGYAIAHLRYRRSEKRERLAMLRSAEMAENRERHQNRIKATRKHRFSTPLELEEVEHTDGHALRLLRLQPDGARCYELETRGRFDDPDLDFMVKGQNGPAEKSELCRQGLVQQLAIEQSEPLTSSKPTRSIEALPESAEPSAPQSANPLAASATQGVRTAASVMLCAMLLGVAGCERVKPEPVRLTLAATKPLAAGSGASLPENVLGLLAPPAPLAGKFVPIGEFVRLDLTENNSESLAPTDRPDAIQKAAEAAWQIDSPAVELAKAAEYVRGRGAGLIAKPAPPLPAEAAAVRLVEAVTAARSEGREVIAVIKAAKDGALPIAKGVMVEARTDAKAACSWIEEKLKAGAQPSVLVLLDPPAYVEPAPVDTPTEGAGKNEPSMPATAAPTVQGATTNFSVLIESGHTPPPKVYYSLPENAVLVGNPVPFESNSAKLTVQGWKAVEEIVTALRQAGRHRVILVASADAVGTEKFNRQLAEHRGETVRAALVEKGMAVESVLAVGESLADDRATGIDCQKFRQVRAYTTEPAGTARR